MTPARTRIRNAGDLAAAVPQMLGYVPQRSLVIIGLTPPQDRICFVFRYGLPAPLPWMTSRVVSSVTGQSCWHVVAVGYGPAALVTPVMDAFLPQAATAGLAVVDALRVGDGHYWSYLSPLVQGRALSAPAPAPGSAASLAAALAPVTGRQQQLMRKARTRVAEEAGRLAAAGGAPAIRQAGIEAVQTAVTGCRKGRLGDASLHAWLALTLTDCYVRDAAWSLMDPRHAGAHMKLWTLTVRRAPDAGGYFAAPALLLAFTAYQTQRIALARAALDIADADAPGYLMAISLRRAIAKGTPPASLMPPALSETGGDH